MINENFVFLASVISLTGAFFYIKDIIKGTVKPNVVTWGLWATAPLLAFAAQLAEHAGLRAVYTFSNAFGPMLIVIAALIKRNAFAKIKKSDYIFGALSVLGLVLWKITGEGFVAIIFAIAADGFAAIPTIFKLYKEPDTENGWIFGFGIVAATITLFTISNWRFEEYAFTVYILFITTLMFIPTGLKFVNSKLKR